MSRAHASHRDPESTLSDPKFVNPTTTEPDISGLPLVLTDRDLRSVLQLGTTKYWQLKRAGLLPERLPITSQRSARYSRAAVLAWLERRGQQQVASGTALRVVKGRGR